MVFTRRPLWRQKSGGPSGYRAYVIGDIHGRLDLLDRLLLLIESDVAARRKATNLIVFLGDLIDRGPDSSGVVERLRLYRPRFGRTMFLAGNHEEVMLRVLGGEAPLLREWLKVGGGECIQSYGVDPEIVKRLPPDRAIELLKKAVPEAHIEFLRSFVNTVSFGSYLFVHAGIRPGVPIDEQRQSDLRWIKHPFLDDCTDHGFTVVHGHTITDEVAVWPNRIGIDTGAYRSGVLTALGIEGRDRWFLQTANASGETAAADPD